MILQNERQYNFAKIQLAKLEAALQSAQNSASDLPVAAQQARGNGVALLISDLRGQLAEYENLCSGEVETLALDEVLARLPETLVRARIARGWTQRQLSEQLGTSEQQVQKDEAGAYARATLVKLSRVAGVLGLSLSGRAMLTCAGAAPKLRSARRAASIQSKDAARQN